MLYTVLIIVVLLNGLISTSSFIITSLSKDFAMSGLRVGVGVVGGSDTRKGTAKVNDMCQVSSHTQVLVEEMLKDEVWVKEFKEEQGRRVKDRYDRVKEALRGTGVRWVEAKAGMFIWMDCRGIMREGETEEELNGRLVEHGVMMTPGESMGMKGGGWFRCVFTAVDDQGFETLIKRLEGLGELRGGVSGGGGGGGGWGDEGPLAGLLKFPSRMKIKVVGPNDDGFVSDITQAVKGVEDVQVENVGRNNKGKWTSVSFDVDVENEQVMRNIYEAIDKDDRVKFKL
ncbi:hypothetical protein TrCOL_g6569 [Triparma columacea]|uniref:Aminotransferase class I/classII large domain-containing protein n=1 Tax=Triparma columacea TaxID=722753 RepID=A0A9W7GJP9_9STRA|nr:hypothetical protein TrCOL_g6569 [Triparma columacea]